jgi:hypothetical protein
MITFNGSLNYNREKLQQAKCMAFENDNVETLSCVF